MTSISIASKHGVEGMQQRSGWIILTLLATAFATRIAIVGDPAFQLDEQFYLLVADRMWHGALPYVDIWDRKPILLFLIYAALRPLSPDGIVAYQVGAMLFATATAFVIVLIARRFASLRGAWLAGVAYLLYLPLLEGGGGQSPIFYNLFLALGGWEALRASEATEVAAIRRHGFYSMLWAGLAIQVKYTAAIDGCAFGLWLIVLSMRRNGGVRASIIAEAVLWITIALAPTLFATGFYILIGHGQEFIHANFLSIFKREEPAGFSNLIFLKESGIRLAFLLPIVVFAIPLLIRRKETGAPVSFLLLWIAFAAADFFAVGNFFDHYALPFLVPTMAACAPLLEVPIGGAAVILFLAYFSVLAGGLPPGAMRQLDEDRISAMVEAAQPYTILGCIYLNDGPPIVYVLTHSCLPTPYVFPSHLNDAEEAAATNATQSMADLLAKRPSAIFVADKPLTHPRNLVTAAMLDAALSSNYTPVATVPDTFPGRHQILYARNDLLPADGTR